ncbi:MAG: CpaF family protein [Alphaproteobacteria bacterium]|nr:CpaF family protein [Alphaproteobacteria bacterium]
MPALRTRIPPEKALRLPRAEIAHAAKDLTVEHLFQKKVELNWLDQRDLITALVNGLLAIAHKEAGHAPAPDASPRAASAVPGEEGDEDSEGPAAPAAEAAILAAVATSEGQEKRRAVSNNNSIDSAKNKIQPLLLQRIDSSAAARVSRAELMRDVTDLVTELLSENKIHLNAGERQELVVRMIDDMLGLGPLEPLLNDENITEIMVNGPKQIYTEERGKLTLSNVKFRDNGHVMTVATRIVTAMGRRIDESSPLCDARLADGSRVNIIIPPLAIDGPTITIRKFSKKKITLDTMIKFGSISPVMATVLRIAGRARCNIIISGGTGSGKTTLLNAMSQMIDNGERIVTIEDAAELQLQQPHVVRLETRPANLEGDGEIGIRDLLKNSLRMRPDRIIVGECRGGEAIDMLQAMNTGHDGSLSTVHANRPREALMRLENMVGLGGVSLPPRAIRMQIASAIDMIVQVSRMRDGSRRITHISEIVGMEGDVITMQDLFTTELKGETPDGKLLIEFKNHGLRPHFLTKAQYFNLDRQLLDAIAEKPTALERK